MGHVKRIWYLLPMWAAMVQASLHICAVSPEPSLLAHTSSESRGTFRQKARSLVLLNGWACAVKICHDGMLEDTNSLDSAHMIMIVCQFYMSHSMTKPTKWHVHPWIHVCVFVKFKKILYLIYYGVPSWEYLVMIKTFLDARDGVKDL